MRSVLITGTSTGLGAHMAVHLARKGFHVFASMRDLSRGLQVRRAVEREALPCELIELDVHDDSSVNSAISLVVSKAGVLDVLINNAGETCPGAIEDVEIAAAQRVFETNYFGAMRTIRAVLPHMRERCSGTIINVSSLAGRYPFACAGHYTASKFALEGASESLALEVGQFNIRVALIEPGVILTPIFGKHQRPVDPGSPYRAQERRAAMMFAQRVRKRTLPRAVAETVESILTSQSGRFRHPVGEDAELLTRMRRRVDDEQLLESGALQSDEDYYDAMLALVGADLFRGSK